MNAAAIHEAGHVVAIHLFGLADVLRPGGAAVKSDGGGIVALDCTGTPDMAALAARCDCTDPSPCEPVLTAARGRPDLVPDLLTFTLAGYGATPETWKGNLAKTIDVRFSSDCATVKSILLDLLGVADYEARDFAAEHARDALDRAAAWAAQVHVRALIDRVAAHLAAHGAANWAELEAIFSANTETSRGETLAPSVCAPGESPLAGATLGTVAGQARPAAVEIQAHNQRTQTKEKRGMTNAHE